MGENLGNADEPTASTPASAATDDAPSSSGAGAPELLKLPRTLGSAAPEDTASRTGAFQALPMVAPSRELLDSAVRRAGRVGPNKKLKNEAQKAKNRCGRWS